MSDSKILDISGRPARQSPCPICDRPHTRLTKCAWRDLVDKISHLRGIAGTVPHLLKANQAAKLYTEELQKMAKQMTDAFDLMKENCLSFGPMGLKIWAKFEQGLESKIVCPVKPTDLDTPELLPGIESTTQSATGNKPSIEETIPGENIVHDF